MSTLRNILRKLYYPLKRSCDYWGYRSFIKKSTIQVENTKKTIDYILSNRVSVSRFGDGEYMVMNHKGNGFQKPNKQLADRLKEVLNSQLPNHIVCLPYAFVSTKFMTSSAKNFWYPFCGSYKNFILSITNPNKVYFDTNFTRFYMDIKNKKQVGSIVISLKKIWENKDLLIVEGEYSRLGIGNDLFNNAKSILRIIAPSQNAFSQYDKLLQTVVKLASPDKLILAALGMTATVLCYDLAKYGFQAIDIGHIDVEYSWFLMGAKRKCPVPGKAVNEISSIPTQICNDNVYKQSIIAVIK